jgi:arabinoxylan arabinofuranohydrolase
MVRGKPTSLAYATSKSPVGPFEYKGIIVDNDGCEPEIWNNHGSIEEVNGQWYVFYHRSSQNRQQKRRLCIEPIFFNVDGTIQEVPMTSQGTGRPYGINETIAAYRAGGLSGGVYIAPLKNGIEGLTGIMDSDEAIFRYVEWEKPVNKISVSGTGSGEINIYLDNNKEPSGSIILENGYIISSTFKGIPGKHEIKQNLITLTN